jgi:GAF domain-containing protein
VDTAGEGDWSEVFPWLAETGRSWRLRRLLETAEAAQRNSAALMRASGNHHLALRAERSAAWLRFTLRDPRAVQRLHQVTSGLPDAFPMGALLAKALEGALSLLAADRGNIQIIDPKTGVLRIAVQHGFGAEFLEYFARVDDDKAACGRAARNRVQVVIADVSSDPGFAPHRAIAAASGFRAVQSTPLVDRASGLLGVVSTHYSSQHRPSDRDLWLIQRYGELVGQAMASHRRR